MRISITILTISLMLAITVHALRYRQEVTAIEQWRQKALQGSASAMQALRDTSIFIIPWERCAWGWILAELDTDQPVPMDTVPVYRQSIRPEGESIMLDYKARLKVRMSGSGI